MAILTKTEGYFIINGWTITDGGTV